MKTLLGFTEVETRNHSITINGILSEQQSTILNEFIAESGDDFCLEDIIILLIEMGVEC